MNIPCPRAVLIAALMLPLAVQAATFTGTSTAELTVLQHQIRAAQFLTRTTFGPTKPEIEALAGRVGELGAVPAFEEWIDAQFALPASYHEPATLQMIADDGFPDPYVRGISTSNYRQYGWWHTVLTAEDQLRQRMAWAMSQLFVTSDMISGANSLRADSSGEPQYLGNVDYYDMLIRHALGNYRDMLGDVTFHPVMGHYLSHLRNPKATETTEPDENYAREVMQLFTIGLYQLRPNGQIKTDRNGNPLPTYDNATIKSFARAFTGLGIARGRSFTDRRANLNEPMIMWEAYHDTDEKPLLRGTVLPAGQDGMTDINQALDNLFAHPNVGPFVARHLIQRLVKSNPSKAYIKAVTAAFNNNGSGVRGDFRAVLKAVLLHDQAVNSYRFKINRKGNKLTVNGRGTEHARLQEPLLRYAALVRGFMPTTDSNGGYLAIPNREVDFNQAPYKAHHVFNFYLPNHTPGGPLQNYTPSRKVPNGSIHAPEMEIFTAIAANRISNRVRGDVNDAKLDLSRNLYQADGTVARRSYDIWLDFSAEQALAGSDPAAMLTRLNVLMCQGVAGNNTIAALETALAAETNTAQMARGAVMALFADPDCAIHE